jgi:hypothetical protein
MTKNCKKLPRIEIIFSTGGEEPDEEISAELPVLTVVENTDKYSIVKGGELIETALAKSFRNLEADFLTKTIRNS